LSVSDRNILLVTLHAKYAHASLALPCLAACCRDLAGVRVSILELTVNEPRQQLLRRIMAEQPGMVAFSCYIWNIETTLRLAADIKQVAADTLVVLGGPEVSFGVFELMHANPAVDFVVKGEGERPFRQLLEALDGKQALDGIENLFHRDNGDIVAGLSGNQRPALEMIPSPFLAGLVDMDKPLTYYETSRGCPFSCAFCLSSVEGQVRSFPMARIESDLAWLMEREVRQVKLVDRTFNYDARRADQIWNFILDHNRVSHFHFEIAADLLTEDNLALLRRVPAETFRFEIGVQSASAETLLQVNRRADLQKIFDNVRRLREDTAIELHLDLVAGLPGEDYDGLLSSLQAVAGLKPHVIQLEPLKLLKGAPMREIADRLGYRYSAAPPYTILTTPWLGYGDICRIEDVGRLLDLFYNQGGFAAALDFMLERMDFAELFDRMARAAQGMDLCGRSTRRLYELFAELAGPLLSAADRLLLYDALFFDYCRNEMPQQGRLPVFIAGRQHDCRWPVLRDLPEGIALPEGSRVRGFRFSFLHDYRLDGTVAAPVDVTFVYVAGQGRGLQVRVL